MPFRCALVCLLMGSSLQDEFRLCRKGGHIEARWSLFIHIYFLRVVSRLVGRLDRWSAGYVVGWVSFSTTHMAHALAYLSLLTFPIRTSLQLLFSVPHIFSIAASLVVFFYSFHLQEIVDFVNPA